MNESVVTHQRSAGLEKWPVELNIQNICVCIPQEGKLEVTVIYSKGAKGEKKVNVKNRQA